jgi:hypothetical protein
MASLYPCLCCGYFTFAAAPPYTSQFCEICFWEDWVEQSLTHLQHAQRNFLTFGACDLLFRNDVRLPNVNDRRLEQWQPLDVLIEVGHAATLQSIATAFDGVTRQNGVTLHEAEVIDDYGSDELRAAAHLKDTDRRWQEVPEADIERLHSLSFLDPVGFCYYLPAYMTWALNHYKTSDSLSIDSAIYSLDISKGLENYSLERFALLDQSQSCAVCQFLRFMANFGNDYVDSRVAQKALGQYWGKYCSSCSGNSAVELALEQYWNK